MAHTTLRALPPLAVRSGRQAHPPKVVALRLSRAIDPLLEGVALADDAIDCGRKVIACLDAGNARAIRFEAYRVISRAQRVRVELLVALDRIEHPRTVA